MQLRPSDTATGQRCDEATTRLEASLHPKARDRPGEFWPLSRLANYCVSLAYELRD